MGNRWAELAKFLPGKFTVSVVIVVAVTIIIAFIAIISIIAIFVITVIPIRYIRVPFKRILKHGIFE